MNEVKQAG